MANQIEILVKANADGAKKAFGSLTEQIAANRKKIGMGLTGIGAGITGLAALSIKAAQEEAIGISKLDQALKNVGTSYDSNKASIEEVISATQRKTNFGDEEQREVLTKLVTVLGDEEKALKALPAVLDASAASGKSAGTVAETMSKFLGGLANTSDAVGLSVDKSANFTERLGAVMEKVGGQAEATSDPFIQFKNRTGDLSQEFGKVLLPIMTDLAGLLDKLTQKVINFTEKHPNLTKWLGIGAAAFGAIALVVGPLLLILPGLAMAFTAVGVAVNLALGPVGLIVLTVAAVTAGVILLWKNWDSVWGKIKQLTQTVVNFVIGLMNKLTLVWRKQIGFILDMVSKLITLGSKLPFVGDKFKDAARAIEEFSDKLDQGIPTIDLTSDKTDEMGEAFTQAEGKVSDATFGIEQAENSLVRTTEQMAVDSSLAWGSVEDAVLQAQGVTLQSLDEMEAAQKAHTDAVNQSWERFLVNQDATVIKLNAANMSFGDVVEGLAIRMGVSTGQMADEIAGFGIKFGDTMALVEEFGRDSIGKVITDFQALKEEAKKEITIRTHRIDNITTNHIETFTQVFHSVMGGNIVGGVLDVDKPTTLTTDTGSGIHLSDPGTDTAVIAANAALEALRGDPSAGGLGGFGAGVSIFDIEKALGLANGGIVRRPTLAMIGERGPEAVIPLGRGGGMGSMNVTVNIAEGAIVGVDDLTDTIAQTVRDVAERGGFRGVF